MFIYTAFTPSGTFPARSNSSVYFTDTSLCGSGVSRYLSFFDSDGIGVLSEVIRLAGVVTGVAVTEGFAGSDGFGIRSFRKYQSLSSSFSIDQVNA